MGISLVANTSTYTTSSGINTTGATLLVAAVGSDSGTTSAPTSSPSNTWTALTQYGNSTGNAYLQIYYVCGPNVSSSQTFTNNAGGGSALVVASFSGTLTSNCLDTPAVNGNAATSTSATVQPGSITPSQAGELLFAACDQSGGSTSNTFTINDSFSSLDQPTSFVPILADFYLVDTNTSAINPTCTNTASNLYLTAAIAAFIPIPSGPIYMLGHT